MKVKCEVRERGTSVNLSTTRAFKKLINGKSIILKPQRTKTSEHQSASCHPDITQCHIKKEKKSLSLVVPPANRQDDLLAFLSPKTVR